jgi:hypothetical protein
VADLPLVTCVITAYNYGRYVGGAIESALNQDWPADRLEVLVVDDGSTDDTAERAERYGERVRVIRQANAGVIAATNRGIAEARGELIALLDADDEWLPHKVAAQVARFARPEVGLVYGNMELMDGAGRTLHPDHFAAHGVAPATGRALGAMMLRNLACTATIMVRRSLAHAFWPLPPNMWCQDWWPAVRVAAVAELDCVPEPVTRYRVHAENRSSHGNQDAKWLKTQAGDVAFRRWMLRHLDLDRVEARHLEPVWVTFLQQLAVVCQGLDRAPAEQLAVTPEDRERAATRVREARAAYIAGDVPRAARRMLAAAGENPVDQAIRDELHAALIECRDHPAGDEVAPLAPARRPFVTVAPAAEAAADPSLLAAYAAALRGVPGATLALHAPDGDEAALAAALGPALAAAGLDDDPETDIVLLCLPSGRGETALADGAGALLSRRPAACEELGWLAPVHPDAAPAILPELAAALR